MIKSSQGWRPRTVWSRKAETNLPSAAVRLDGVRVYLRPAILSDYPQWADVRGRNEAFLKPYEPAWPEGCLSAGTFKRRVERLSREASADKTYGFLMFERGGDTLTGGININNVTRGAAQMASLGYWLDEDCQGRGLMGEALQLVLSHAFGPLSLARMNAATLVHNERSRKMLQRAGFIEEGFARAYIQINGERQDHVLYGLNAKDWIER